MREIVEEVYDLVFDFFDDLVYYAVKGFLIITSPFWVIPYMIYLDKKEDPEE